MNLSNFLLSVCLFSVPLAAAAQGSVTSTRSGGYLSRGVLMEGNNNYVGAIDQLTHMRNLPASASEREEADYHAAMSAMELGKDDVIDRLNAFLANYPSSLHCQQVRFTIGNYYFFNGKYGEALRAYQSVRNGALDSDNGEDLIYRQSYSDLRLANYDDAKLGFNRLSSTARYHDAATFYQAYIDYANKRYDAAQQNFERVSRNGELGYAAQYYLSQIYFTKEDYQKVIALGGSLLADNNDNAELNGELNRIVGESQYHQGNDAAALTHINSYLQQCDGKPQRSAEYVLGVMEYRRADYQSVIEHLGDVTDGEDALAQSAYLYIGQSYLKTGQLNSASIAFEKALNMPYSRDVQETAFYNYAITQNEGGRTPFNKSIDLFEKFLNKYPDSKYASQVEDYLVNAYTSGNNYSRALASIQRIDNPSAKVLKAKAYVLYNLGVQSLSNDRVTEAKKYFSEARGMGQYNSSSAAESNLWLGECEYRLGNFSAAERYQQQYLQSVSAGSTNYGLAYYDLAYSKFQQKKYSDARDYFQKAVASSTLAANLKADANNRIGDTYYYDRQYATAEDYYGKAHTGNASSGDYALFQKAMMQGLSRNYSAKISGMDQLIREYPSSQYAPEAMLEKAQAQIAASNSAGAVGTYKELISRYPATVDARKGQLQLAITERNMGDQAKAIEEYKKVITKYPSSEEARVAAEDMKQIYAENGNLNEFAAFLKKVPNAPKINTSDIDRLTFEAAEKTYLGDKHDLSKIRAYISRYPNGAYADRARYYLAKDNYNKGRYNEALTEINSLLDEHQDASFAEDALAMKGDILSRLGRNVDAFNAYKGLAGKSSSADMQTTAELGVMRTAKAVGRYNDVVESADALLNTGGLSAEEEKEALLNRALAYSNLGRGKQAEKDFAKLAKDPRNEYGAEAAYRLAEYYYNEGNLNETERVLNNFIDEGTPHQYWLAKGFILLADAMHKQGKNYEASEYLESLKSNYPGKETEIYDAIDQRLKSWGTTKSMTKPVVTEKKSKVTDGSKTFKKSKTKKSTKGKKK
jgi:TolA-binding protein